MSRHSHIPFVEKSKTKSDWVKKQRHLIIGAAALVIRKRVVSLVSVPLLKGTCVIGCNACNSINIAVELALRGQCIFIFVGN